MAVDKNSVWRLNGAEGLQDDIYRVIEIIPHLDCIILFQLTDTGHLQRPVAKMLSTFTKWSRSGIAGLIEWKAPYFLLEAEEDIPPKSRTKRDKNFDLINELASDIEFLFAYATSKRMLGLAEYAKRKGVDRKKISRLLNTYWRLGQTKNAFLPAYANSGGSGGERLAMNGALGAPRTSRTLGVERAPKYVLNTKDKQNIRKALNKHYLKVNGKSLKESYKQYLRQYHAEEIKLADACKRAPIVPSLRQFSYWRNRLISEDTIIRKRSTERDYLLKKRSVIGLRYPQN
ncbi:hypothetical protein [Pseudoalteromonas sp. S16_S37]|uniref:hypothetical protein n=1 Tax=Pseudoalteromonas sp. S16_S37 TaxID=2720228 RepID=UPI001681831D|nr:hypothetical protein [Pseudoalteromonas sp. S16_S37]MBD1583096.1 hypothetical protein [Pseudoalteromonas sp. S16_S37]